MDDANGTVVMYAESQNLSANNDNIRWEDYDNLNYTTVHNQENFKTNDDAKRSMHFSDLGDVVDQDNNAKSLNRLSTVTPKHMKSIKRLVRLDNHRKLRKGEAIYDQNRYTANSGDIGYPRMYDINLHSKAINMNDFVFQNYDWDFEWIDLQNYDSVMAKYSQKENQSRPSELQQIQEDSLEHVENSNFSRQLDLQSINEPELMLIEGILK